MTATLLIFMGQFAHAVLRTAAVQAIAKERTWGVIGLNLAANAVRLLVLSGAVFAVQDSDWIGVGAFLAGQAAGDWLSMRWGGKALAQ